MSSKTASITPIDTHKPRRCASCGTTLPKDITHLEAVQVLHQRKRQWHHYCETCLDKITKPYITRWDFELQQQSLASRQQNHFYSRFGNLG